MVAQAGMLNTWTQSFIFVAMHRPSLQTQRIKVLFAGIASLVVMLGVARFAYTPMLPLMQQQAGLGVAEAGWLATFNYAGYLIGALATALINDPYLKTRLFRAGLLLALLTTAIMATTTNLWLWSASRFLAGLSSAAGLLLGSGLILNWLIRNGFRSELGVHFSGMGIGIFATALLVDRLSDGQDWAQLWWLLTALGVALTIPIWLWWPKADTTQATRLGEKMQDRAPPKTFMRLFMLAYFCAGVAYVVSITFISAIVDDMPSLQGKGSWAFMALGLGAAPACIFWDRVARRLGDFNALICAGVLQLCGILMPVLWPSMLPVLFGAALFGGTFIGMVSLVLTMAGRYYPTRPAKMMGKMTISYGVAQIIGPALTGVIAEHSGSYTDGLYISAIILLLGIGLLVSLRSREIQH